MNTRVVRSCHYLRFAMIFRTKPFSLFANSLLVLLALAATGPVLAQSPNSTTPQRREQTARPDFFNLTPTQQAQMAQIRQQERAAIENILTADQKAQLQSDRQQRQPRQRGQSSGTPGSQAPRGQRPPSGNPGSSGGPFAALNLSPDQRSQIAVVMQNSRQQMDALLTAEQRQQLQQHLQQHQQQRQANPAGN